MRYTDPSGNNPMLAAAFLQLIDASIKNGFDGGIMSIIGSGFSYGLGNLVNGAFNGIFSNNSALASFSISIAAAITTDAITGLIFEGKYTGASALYSVFSSAKGWVMNYLEYSSQSMNEGEIRAGQSGVSTTTEFVGPHESSSVSVPGINEGENIQLTQDACEATCLRAIARKNGLPSGDLTQAEILALDTDPSPGIQNRIEVARRMGLHVPNPAPEIRGGDNDQYLESHSVNLNPLDEVKLKGFIDRGQEVSAYILIDPPIDGMNAHNVLIRGYNTSDGIISGWSYMDPRDGMFHTTTNFTGFSWGIIIVP